MNFFDYTQVSSQVPDVLPQKILTTYQHLNGSCQPLFIGQLYIYDVWQQHLIYSSCSLAQLLGYPADPSANGNCFGLAQLIHPDDLAPVSDYFQRFSSLRGQEVISLTYRMQRPDGTWAVLRSQDTPLAQNSQGLPLQVMGLVQDLTAELPSELQPRFLPYTHQSVTAPVPMV